MKISNGLTSAQRATLESELRREYEKLENVLQRVTAGGEGAARLRDSARHEQIAEALRRLDDGSYGMCAGCGQPIAFGRLLVMPEATRCVSCAAHG